MICSPGLRNASARLRLTRLVVISASFNLTTVAFSFASGATQFQSSFMRQDQGQATETGNLALEALSKGHDLGPGRYWVLIQANSQVFEQQLIRLQLSTDGETLQPCLPASLLALIGVKLDSVQDPASLQAACVDLLNLIPGSKVDFDNSKMLLDISIPQIALRRDVVGHVDPKRWDTGINAAFINYQASAQQSSNRYRGESSSQDLLLSTGINLGEWRFRSSQSFRQDDSDDDQWTRSFTYLQRDIPGTRANLTLGEASTEGDIFRSIPIQGVVLRSDPGMLPDVLQSYAPIIRGVALTRAKLEVRQNGYPIYSTYVSAGPYEIDDLSTAGGSGELEVVLTEEDGQVRRFTQPYATLSNLLREGVWRYSAAGGRYNAATHLSEPMLWQGTLAMGTAWNSTLYGGVMGSNFYQAGTVGVAKDLGAFGALAFDATRSSAQINSSDVQSLQGLSYAIKFGKSFNSGTNLRFAGYRYSTEGYRDFDEALRQRSQDSTFFGSRRSRIEASIYQRLTTRSSLNLSLSHQDYWGTNYKQRQFQFSFNTQYQDITFNLFASQSLSDTYASDRQIGLSISMPLDFARASNVTFDLQKNANLYSQRASMSGSAYDNTLNYRGSISHTDQQRESVTLSANYQAPFASMGSGITVGREYRSLSLNTNGAIMLHDQGITFSPYLGETMALIQVPEIAGVGVANAGAMRTNDRGFVLAPYLRPYRVNYLELNTDDLSPNIEIENATAQVVPRRGAIVKSVFSARKVNRLLITATTVNGQPLPFAAQVSSRTGEQMGIIGQAGQMLLSTTLQSHTLNVRWGPAEEQSCKMQTEPTTMQEINGFHVQKLVCQ